MTQVIPKRSSSPARAPSSLTILHRPAADIASYHLEGTVQALGPDRCRLTMGAWSWADLPPPSPAPTPTSNSSNHPNSTTHSPNSPAAHPPLPGHDRPVSPNSQPEVPQQDPSPGRAPRLHVVVNSELVVGDLRVDDTH